MARPARFSDQQIIDAASRLAASSGPKAMTITAVGAAIGAPNGSIYHRFQSRDELLGRVWLQKAAFHQDTFAAALELESEPLQVAIGAALSIARSTRADLQGARIMLLHRPEDFLSESWRPELQAEAARLRKQVTDLVGVCALRFLASTTREAKRTAAFVFLDIPLAAVRRYVAANEMPPPQVDRMIAAAVTAILERENSRSSTERVTHAKK